MIRNYLVIALRSLLRSKVHSSINILGLSLGIVCCILISLFVYDEMTFDRFHTKAERIYRVFMKENWGENQEFFNTVTPFPMGPTLKGNFEEIEHQVRVNAIGTQIKVNDQPNSETVVIAGQDFFEVFDFKLIKGESRAALQTQSSVVITERTAIRFFGTNNAIGKSISIQLGEAFEEFRVEAVAEDIPTNSSIQFDILISDLNYPKLYSERALTSAWFNVIPETYILVRSDVKASDLEKKFPPLFKTVLGEERLKESKFEAGLQPLTSIHLAVDFPAGLAPVSNPRYSYILSAIALLILVVGCINFVTLSIGRSLKRVKEVGIRKVVGALRKQLIAQFVGEAILITIISLFIGIAAAYWCLPLFNELSGKVLVFPWNEFLIVVAFVLLVIIGFLAGSYPAFFLSGFQPIEILKGKTSGGNNQNLRKVLVGIQLVLSVFLISSTLIMQNQLQFLQNKNLGFSKEHLVIIPLNVPSKGRLPERVAAGFQMAEQFKTGFSTIKNVNSVATASHDFGNGNWLSIGYTDDGGTYRTFRMNIIDADYIPVMNMELAQGRNFDSNNTSDTRRAVIINESFAKAYGWTDAIGKRIPGKNFEDHEVIGVVKDFHYNSLHTSVEPLVMVQNPVIILKGTENINIDNSPVPKLVVRLLPGDITATVEEIKNVWTNLTAGEEFLFSFVDQALNRQYRNDQNLGKIVRIATFLAILIGSLGLYGLASLAMQNRVKEISIRKVLGASEKSILVLLSREYVLLILICSVISIPVTIYLMSGWLAQFEYRVEMGWSVFMLATSLALLVALATIGYHALKASWTQPVQSLKHE